MRPLVFHYANDKNDQSREESFSWMLGRDLLVAPVLEEHHTNKVVYFPGDDEWWCDLHDGTWYQGKLLRRMKNNILHNTLFRWNLCFCCSAFKSPEFWLSIIPKK